MCLRFSLSDGASNMAKAVLIKVLCASFQMFSPEIFEYMSQ